MRVMLDSRSTQCNRDGTQEAKNESNMLLGKVNPIFSHSKVKVLRYLLISYSV